MNFFPSENKGECFEVAMFVSFHKPIFGLKFKKRSNEYFRRPTQKNSTISFR